jgi:hypothetical protein
MFDIFKKFTVTIPGRGSIQLGPNDHVTSGGEGHIFKKSGGRIGSSLAIKIWDDPNHAIQNRMPEKIKLLATLKHPNIVAPEALAVDDHGVSIGYVMPWVEGGWALPMAFTNDWRSANAFGDAEARAFASRMREVVTYAHHAGFVLGDANELNILGIETDRGCSPRYIDVDPWVLPGFPGDKVLPTIHDYHAAPFTKEADWFAYAVTSFQLLVGVHPYRGTHRDFKRADLEGRMKANASVFEVGVGLSPAVRDFNRIPGPLLDWYRQVFMQGLRCVPPDPGLSPAVTVQAMTVGNLAGGDVTISVLYALRRAALRVVAPDVLQLEGGMLVSLADGRDYGRADTACAFRKMPDGAIAGIRIVEGKLQFGLLRAAPGAILELKDAGVDASAVWSAGNRLFAVVGDGILELQVTDLGVKVLALPGKKWALNPYATAFGDGLAIYDALGAKHFVAPFGPGAVAILRVRELDGLKPLAMVRRERVAVVTLIDKKGAYKRAVVTFTADFGSYAITVSDADDGSLVDAITDSGVVVRFDGDGKLELSVPAIGGKRVADAGSLTRGLLMTGPSGVFCAVDGKVVKLSLV